MTGAILFPAGVTLVILKGESFVAAPIVGSLIVTAAMALLAVIVFRTAGLTLAGRDRAIFTGDRPLAPAVTF